MAAQFKEQGGAATMDPSNALRWGTSKLMTTISSEKRLVKKRAQAEKERQKARQPHVVEYFHQVDDGYSHLTAQILASFTQRYDISLKCHLVSGPVGKNVPEPELLLRLARYDSFHVAPEYGLEFPRHENELSLENVQCATQILAAQSAEGFTANAAEVGRALWSDDAAELEVLGERLGKSTASEAQALLVAGSARRDELSHYSGAMFYYAGEWYWGVDRLYHLEKRLAALGADNTPDQPLLVPRPEIEVGDKRNNGSLTLEVFPSLRSPYTAMSFDRVVKLAADTGVNLVVRPVLPMVMRGVPATRQKGMYIFTDAAREARAAGVPYGNFYDPIGEPARRAYSLFPWACEQGKGNELLSAFLSCAFARGINTNNDKGLKRVVEEAGLSWEQAKQKLGDETWVEQLENNRLAMYDSGLWGVPSFRLLNASGELLLALWGQDRLWLFARAIQRQIAAQ